MKSKIKFRLVGFLAALMLLSFTTKAQTYADNHLNCDVIIFYEMFEPSPSCMAVCSGTLVVPANTIGLLIPDCTPSAGPCDICIIIMDIGGWTPPSNHSSNNVGHILTPYGQSGVTGSGACTAGTPWTATQSVGSWVIQ